MTEFSAFRLHREDEGGVPEARIETLAVEDLSAGDVVIKVAYSSLNYKDALAYKGIGKIISSYPRVTGIDLAGTIVASQNATLAPGTKVIVHGFGIGVNVDGGHAQMARVKSEWVLPLPEEVSLLDAATLGAAGFTAGLSIDWLERCGVLPTNGPVAVTGATGGVGSLAVHLLSAYGYEVVALSGKTDAKPYLKALGASHVQAIPNLENIRALRSAQWAGAIDSVGGDLLAWLLSSVRPEGAVASFGNAGGFAVNTTVYPFILRGVKLLGINANSPMPVRQRIWRRILQNYDSQTVNRIRNVITLPDLSHAMEAMLDRNAYGRFVIQLD